MTSIYTKLFNVVFDNAIIPESWKVGVIKPIYKNKGDPPKKLKIIGLFLS